MSTEWWGMSFDCAEIELGGDQSDNRRGSRHAHESVGEALAGLPRSIEGLQVAAGLSYRSAGHDALQIVAREVSDLVHRVALGAIAAGAPMLKHGTRDVEMLAPENLVQLLYVRPGAGSAQETRSRDPSGDDGRVVWRVPRASVEQCARVPSPKWSLHCSMRRIVSTVVPVCQPQSLSPHGDSPSRATPWRTGRTTPATGRRSRQSRSTSRRTEWSASCRSRRIKSSCRQDRCDNYLDVRRTPVGALGQ